MLIEEVLPHIELLDGEFGDVDLELDNQMTCQALLVD